jgi:hypothetical protein
MRLVLLAGVLASTLWSSNAAAQLCLDAGGEVAHVPVQGTVGFGANFGALDKVTQIYGAAHLADRLLDTVQEPQDSWGFVVDNTTILNLVSLPVCSGQERGPGMGAVDFGTGGLGLALRLGDVRLFYAGNSTYRAVRSDSGWARGNVAFWLPLMGSILSPFAVLGKGYTGNALTLHWDFIAGASYEFFGVQLGAGLVASRGLYGNLRTPFGWSAMLVADGLHRVPVASTCLDDAMLQETAVIKAIGVTRVCLRKLNYNAPPGGNVPFSELSTTVTGGFPFTTVHFEQNKIAGVLDVQVAGRVRPGYKVEFYDAVVAIQTDWVRFYGGAVRTPRLYAYGSGGGLLPKAGIQAGAPPYFMIGLALNAGDIVSVFPAAHNVVSLTLSAGA